MRPDRGAGLAAALAVAATGGAAAWGFAIQPASWLRWVLTAAVLPVVWAFVEAAQVRGRDESVGRAIMTMIRCCIAWAGLMVGLHLALRLAVRTELLSRIWLTAGAQLLGILLGAGMVLFGNALPTLRSPWPYPHQPFAWQPVHRFVGWAFVLGGLGVISCWVLLPPEAAPRAAARLLVITMVVSVGRKLASVVAHADRPLA